MLFEWGFTSATTATGHIRKRKDKKNGEKGTKGREWKQGEGNRVDKRKEKGRVAKENGTLRIYPGPTVMEREKEGSLLNRLYHIKCHTP